MIIIFVLKKKRKDKIRTNPKTHRFIKTTSHDSMKMKSPNVFHRPAISNFSDF